MSCLILALAVLAVRYRRLNLASVPLVLALVATLIVQALLGMLTVTWRLNPLIVTGHLVFGMTTLALFWWLTLSLPVGSWGAAALHARGRNMAGGAGGPFASAWVLAVIGLVALAVQITLGGWTSSNYAAVACPDFPTCQSAWWPVSDYAHAFVLWHGQINYEGGVLDNPARVAIHLTHRLGALVATSAHPRCACSCSGGTRLPWRARAPGRCSQPWRCSSSIGVSMVLKAFPLWLATAHTAGAALLLLATLALVRALRAS